MAAPASASVTNVSGVWRLDSTKSDSLEPMLKIQGVPWLLRKTLPMVTLEVFLQHIPAQGDAAAAVKAKTVIKPGSFEAVEYTHTLDNQVQEKIDPKQGRVTSQNRIIPVAEIADDDVREKIKAVFDGDEVLVEYFVAHDKGWSTDGYWMFEVMNGQRYLTRLTLARGAAKERVLLHSVYAYIGENV